MGQRGAGQRTGIRVGEPGVGEDSGARSRGSSCRPGDSYGPRVRGHCLPAPGTFEPKKWICALVSEWKMIGQNSVLDKLLSKICSACDMVLLQNIPRFLEKTYVMKDPITPDKEKFLIVGSHCSSCTTAVCVGTGCSLFYSKSFCLPCVKENLNSIPLEIKEDMDKRKPQQKSCNKADIKHKS
ncbi:hypothetical protein Nmel_005969 [Mimus melanotis]